MIEADSNAMDVKRDLLNQRMKERHQQREMEISRCFEDREGLQTLQFNLLYFFQWWNSVLIFYKCTYWAHFPYLNLTLLSTHLCTYFLSFVNFYQF